MDTLLLLLLLKSRKNALLAADRFNKFEFTFCHVMWPHHFRVDCQHLLRWPVAVKMATKGATSSAPVVSSNDEVAAEKVAQCMRMLEGNTDEHKFAGLLMVTKLDDLRTEQLQQVRRQVLSTVGVSFFLRLLQHKGAYTVHRPILLIE